MATEHRFDIEGLPSYQREQYRRHSAFTDRMPIKEIVAPGWEVYEMQIARNDYNDDTVFQITARNGSLNIEQHVRFTANNGDRSRYEYARRHAIEALWPNMIQEEAVVRGLV